MTTIDDVLTKLEGLDLPPGVPIEDEDGDFYLRFGEGELIFDLYDAGYILTDAGGEYVLEEVEEIALDALAALRLFAHEHPEVGMDSLRVRLADVPLPSPEELRWEESLAAYVPGDEFRRFSSGSGDKFDVYPDGMILGFDDRPFEVGQLTRIVLGMLALIRTIRIRRTAATN